MSVILDHEILEPAALLMFRRLTFAEGEVNLPCLPELLDTIMELLLGLLAALAQRPPAAEIAQWRSLIESKLTEGAANQQRLVFRYEPYDPLVGLTGGFQLRLALHPPLAIPLTDRPDLPPMLRLERLTIAWGEMRFPCVPALAQEPVRMIGEVLGAVGQEFSVSEQADWQEIITTKLGEWFADSHESRLVVRFDLLEPPLGLAGGVELNLTQTITSIESHYKRWTETRVGPLFGAYADAKVLAVAQSAGSPILDIGAGTGRNSLTLACLGYTVTALELTHVLMAHLETAATDLPITVLQGDIFDPALKLNVPQYAFIFLSEVIASHFHDPSQVRTLALRVADLLPTGGYLLFNTFMAVEDYDPTPTVRQLSLVYWSYVMTYDELHSAMAGLPFTLVSDESVYDYEQAHLPPEHWPPTSWFGNWATGRNLFPIKSKPPIELRWLLYQKT